MTTFSHTVGDIEYDIEIDGGDYYIAHVYQDLGIDIDRLYFIDQNNKQVCYSDYLAEKAYDKFLDDWGSEKTLNNANYADFSRGD